MNEQPPEAGTPAPDPTPEVRPAGAGTAAGDGGESTAATDGGGGAAPTGDGGGAAPTDGGGGSAPRENGGGAVPTDGAPGTATSDSGGGAAVGDAPSGPPEAREGSAAGAAAPGATGTEERPKRRRRRRRKRKPDGAEGDAATDVTGAEGAPAAAVPAGDRPPRKKRRNKRERGDGPKSAPGPRRGERRPEHLGSMAVKALSEMARALLDAEGVDPFGRPRWLDLRVKVPLEPDRDATRSSRDVVRQLLERVEEVRRHESALRPGSVYCYFSDSADAPTSRPTKPREVFDGFGSTGRPTFTDFVTLAIERRDPGIDELVNGADVIVTHVSMGRVLRTQQLHEFGAESPVYRILGQVDAGLYPMMGSDQKAAFSFQLLKGTTLDGIPRFRLHWVGAAEVRDIADPMVGSILKRFQQHLDRESLRYAGLGENGSAPDEEEFVLPMLQELGKRLAGRARRAGRRTEHATQRADERQRPTAKAWDDAKEAGDDRILRDDEQGTIVIVGPKNRVHVFSFEAKHVTSLVMTGGNVHKRKAEGRWHAAEPEERGEFRIALKKRLKEGEDQVADGEQPAV